MARHYHRRADTAGSDDAAETPEPVGWIARAILTTLAAAKNEVPRQALIQAVFGKAATGIQGRQVTWALTALKESGRVENTRRGWWRMADDR